MTDQKKTKEPLSPLIPCRVLKGQIHNHKGRDYAEYAEIDLTKDQAQWLVGAKKVEIIK